MISSVLAHAAGGYAVPVETPIAPEASDSRAISRIFAISAGVAARSSRSIVATRNVVWPTRHAALIAAGSRFERFAVGAKAREPEPAAFGVEEIERRRGRAARRRRMREADAAVAR